MPVHRNSGAFSHLLRIAAADAEAYDHATCGIRRALCEASMRLNGTGVSGVTRLFLASVLALLGVAALAAEIPGNGANSGNGANGGNGRPPLTVDAFSVVRLHARAVPDARSRSTLGPEREGTGIVIDSSGLILTIGYLIQEAETVEINAVDGRKSPATVIAYDYATGFGLLRALTPPVIKPIEFGESKGLPDREPVLIVGFDGVAPAFVVSKRPFAGNWEYLLDEAIFTAPATVNWQGAALVNKEGKLIGVGSLAVGDAMGGRQVPGNMFVPIDLLKPILGNLIAQGKAGDKPRPWLGVNTQDLQGKLMVTRVSPDSPADKAGLTAGDIILGVRGEQFKGHADFYKKIWSSGEAG
ncbi:MAG: serine protease, partial [Betaproteobacteria bacterium]|nr:serine protease [Betaproteobacteria bacterium]